jgi:uncharacterized protein (UPF0212 family)
MSVSIHEYVDLDAGRLRCAACGQDLGDAHAGYRAATVTIDEPVAALGALFAGMTDTVDEQIVFRTYNCPGCGRRLDAEICPRSAAPLRDLEVADT